MEGEVLDPWSPIDGSYLGELLRRIAAEGQVASKTAMELFLKKAENFIRQVKKMILEANYIPDLAGVENLLVTPTGDIRLVDINNVSKVTFGPTISTDDRGYPVCDKSVEALSLLEQKLLAKPIDMEETIYRTFLNPHRMMEVKSLEERFHISMKLGVHSPAQ